jgi:hypothetical protein
VGKRERENAGQFGARAERLLSGVDNAPTWSVGQDRRHGMGDGGPANEKDAASAEG